MAAYLLIGVVLGFVIGFWFRHQFEFIKVREGSAFSAKKPNAPEPEVEPKHKPVVPIRSDRTTNFINKLNKKNSGMNQ